MKNRITENKNELEARMVTEEDIEELNNMNKEPKKEQETNTKTKEINHSQPKEKFNRKFFVTAISVILLSFLAAFFIKRSYAILGEQNITYQENSNLDYKVYLKQNDFYEDDYLDKNMVYVASLIDKIDVDFNYTFKIDKKSNIDFEYDIIGKLVISDKSKGKTFFEKEYTLLENTKDTMTEDGLHQIKKSVNIDYGKYNNIANQFRSRYGVDASCNLVVYLNIHEKSNNKNKFNLNNNSNMSLTIPLSERAINITMDYNEVNKTSKLVRDKELVITNYLYVILGIICSILLVITLVKFAKLLLSLREKRSKYDKYVNRLLREYDRLIVETATKPNLENKNIVRILKFQELLDVRDNLKLPIKYYVRKNHQECYFYINHEEETYLFKIDANDFKEGI